MLTKTQNIRHASRAMAKSMARFDSRNIQRRDCAINMRRFFYALMFQLADCVREPYGSPGSFVTGLSTACDPPFFLVDSKHGGSPLQFFHKGGSL